MEDSGDIQRNVAEDAEAEREISRRLEASRAKYKELSDRKNQVDAAYEKEKRARLAEVQADLGAKYDDVKGELHRLLSEARVELDRDTYAAAALKFEGHPFKPGTRMVEWYISTRHGAAKWSSPTGRVGVMEVFGPGSACRGSFGPNVGELCLRVLKKDGTPSLTVLRFSYGGFLPSGWYPEGVDPNSEVPA